MLVGGDRLFFILVHALTLAPNQFSQLIKWREVKSNSCTRGSADGGFCFAAHPEMTKVAVKCQGRKTQKFLAIKIALKEDFHKPS
jgi:hypothetical protein